MILYDEKARPAEAANSMFTYDWDEVAESGLSADRWMPVLLESRTADGRPAWYRRWIRLAKPMEATA